MGRLSLQALGRWLRLGLGVATALFFALFFVFSLVFSQSARAQIAIASQNSKLNIPTYWFKADATQPRPAIIALH